MTTNKDQMMKDLVSQVNTVADEASISAIYTEIESYKPVPEQGDATSRVTIIMFVVKFLQHLNQSNPILVTNLLSCSIGSGGKNRWANALKTNMTSNKNAIEVADFFIKCFTKQGSSGNVDGCGDVLKGCIKKGLEAAMAIDVSFKGDRMYEAQTWINPGNLTIAGQTILFMKSIKSKNWDNWKTGLYTPKIKVVQTYLDQGIYYLANCDITFHLVNMIVYKRMPQNGVNQSLQATDLGITGALEDWYRVCAAGQIVNALRIQAKNKTDIQTEKMAKNKFDSFFKTFEKSKYGDQVVEEVRADVAAFAAKYINYANFGGQVIEGNLADVLTKYKKDYLKN